MRKFLKRLWCRLRHPRTEWRLGYGSIIRCDHVERYTHKLCFRCWCEHDVYTWKEPLPNLFMSKINDPTNFDYESKPE